MNTHKNRTFFILKNIIEEQEYLILNKKLNKKIFFDMYNDAIIQNITNLIYQNLGMKYKKDYDFTVFYSSSLRCFCVRFNEYNDENKLLNYLKENYKLFDLLYGCLHIQN